jgi:photosystem II stability/assembly factor-like uncharacterized protein
VHRIAFDGSTWNPVQNAGDINGVDVTCLTQNERGIYVGSREHGVLFIAAGSRVLRSISNGLQRSVIQSISRLRSTLIIGTRAEGVFAVDTVGGGLRSLNADLPTSGEYSVTTVDTTILVALSSGAVVRSEDEGRTWKVLDTLFPNSMLNNLQEQGGSVIASTVRGVLVSRDHGDVWTSLHRGLDTANVTKVFVGRSMTIVCSPTSTKFLYPDGRLETFTRDVDFPSAPRLYDVVFRGNAIYAVGYPGLFVSNDNGATWRVQTFEKSAAFRALTLVGDRLLAVTDAGILLTATLP